MLRGYLLAVLVQMVAVNLAAEFGRLRVAVPPFYGLATALGGWLFGLGMLLAVGCAGAVLFRAGEGKLDYGLTCVAYAGGIWGGTKWLAAPVRRVLDGSGAALAFHQPHFLDRRLVLVILAVAILIWLWRGEHRPYQGGWDWGRTGFLLGLVAIAAWGVSALAGSPSGLVTSQGAERLATLLLERDPSGLNWSVFLVLGIPLGSWIAARLHGASLESGFRAEHLPRGMVGGLLMGIGAALAGGDNIAHGLGGVPLLAWASVVFMACVFLGVWCGVRLHWLRTEAPPKLHIPAGP
jgi:uncharacterized protein